MGAMAGARGEPHFIAATGGQELGAVGRSPHGSDSPPHPDCTPSERDAAEEKPLDGVAEVRTFGQIERYFGFGLSSP